MIHTDIFDLHCDTLLKLNKTDISNSNGHINTKKLICGCVTHQCFAVFPEDEFFYMPDGSFSYYLSAVEKYKKTKYELSKYGITAHLTVEDCQLMGGKTERISKLKNDGVIIAGLVWNRENVIGFPHTNKREHLKPFGFECVSAFIENNIFIDVSHLNYTGFFDIYNNFKTPVFATHSACKSLCNHTRNLDDVQLKAIGQSGGIVGIPFYPPFIKENSSFGYIDDVVKHIVYAVNVAGINSVGLGSDFDGFSCPTEIKNASFYPFLAQKIIDRLGYEAAEKICCKNALNLFK